MNDTEHEQARATTSSASNEGPSKQINRYDEEIVHGASKRGGILAALRRSPLVGGDLDLSRPRGEGEDVSL